MRGMASPPPEKRLPVNVESLTTALSRLCVNDMTLDGTPWSTSSRRRGRLGAKRTLFPESEGVPLEAGTSPVARRSVAQLDSQSQRDPVWTVTEEQALVNFLAALHGLMLLELPCREIKVIDFGRTPGRTLREWFTQSIVEQVG